MLFHSAPRPLTCWSSARRLMFKHIEVGGAKAAKKEKVIHSFFFLLYCFFVFINLLIIALLYAPFISCLVVP